MKTITINVPDDCEVKIVRKEEEKKKGPVIRTYQDLIDNRISCRGYYIDLFSELEPVNNGNFDSCYDRNIATTEKVAKSMLAMAQISQLMPYYGGEITPREWGDLLIKKWCITKCCNKMDIDTATFEYHFLAFHTEEQRNEFIEYNGQLVKDYLMID